MDGEEYPAYDAMVSKLLEHKFLPEKEVLQLCERARSLLSEESNVHPVRAPVTVVGDIHGQFHDMLEMFKLGGPAPDTNYLFLGDYVDRTLLRGDGHLGRRAEGADPDRVTIIETTVAADHANYGFYDGACAVRYAGVWKAFTIAPTTCRSRRSWKTRSSPHGGLSPSIDTMDDVRKIDRFRKAPKSRVRPGVVRSRRPRGWGSGRGVHVRAGHHGTVQPRERAEDHARASARHGGYLWHRRRADP